MNFGKKEWFVGAAVAVCFSVICLCMAKNFHKKYDFNCISRSLPTVPVIIIGSGPAGLSAAIEGAQVGLSAFVIRGDMPGGLITQTGFVENWPGNSHIPGSDIADNLHKQAQDMGAQFLDDTVTRVDFSCWPFKIYTEGDRCIQALSVIIATGSAPKKLGIPGEKEYWGAGVSACATCDAPLYKGKKDVLVIGGGDSAIKEAIHLAQFAQNVTILVRRNSMRASAHNQEHLLEYPNVSVVYNVNPQEIVGVDGRVTGVQALDTVTNEVRIIPANGVFLAVGHEPNTQLFKDFIALDEMTGTIKLTKGTKETSLEGVFAAGDVAERRRQAWIAATSGGEAAFDAKEFLDGLGFTKQAAAKLRLLKPNATGVDVQPALPAADGSVKELFSLADFTREVQEKKGLVCMNIVDTSGQGQMEEVVRTVAQELAGTMVFVTVDKNKAADIAQRFFVDRTPCRLVFNNGSLVARNQRDMNAQELGDFAQQIAHESAEANPVASSVA